MTFFKSIILLVFCIGWVKAIQYDIDNEVNKIFHKVRQSIEDAWRWIQIQANRSFLGLNEVFTMRRPPEQGRHKYQHVIPSYIGMVKSDNESAESGNVTPPQTIENSANTVTTFISDPEMELPSTSPQEIINEIPVETIAITPEIDTTIISDPKMELPSTSPQEIINEIPVETISITPEIILLSTPPENSDNKIPVKTIPIIPDLLSSTLSQEVENKIPVKTIAVTPEIELPSIPSQELDNENPIKTIAIWHEYELPSLSSQELDNENPAKITTVATTPEVDLSTSSQNLNITENPPAHTNLQEANQNETDINPEEVEKLTEQSGSECEDSATELLPTNIPGMLILGTQSEAEISSESEHKNNELESPAVQEISEGDSQPIQSELESDMEAVESSREKEKADQVPESDRVESPEIQNKMDTLASIYSQQSVLIKILCCLVILLALRSIFNFVESEILHRDSGIVIAANGNWKKTPMVSVVRSEHLIKNEK